LPNYRLLHVNLRTGKRSKQLTRLERDVWIAYMLSADDFGVCPASARRLQADDRWLAKEATTKVQRCFDVLIQVDLLRAFEDGGDRYVYQWDWQDYQRILHPSRTSRPRIPTAHLEQCSAATILFMLEHHEDLVTGWFPEFAFTFLKQFPKLSQKVLEKFTDLSEEIAELFLPHAGARNAPATAIASASDLREESRETFPPPRRGHGLLVSPLEWDRLHGKHVTALCDWVCLPRFLALEFAQKSGSVGDVGPVTTWALGVRAEWESRGPIGDDSLVFWRARWAATHGTTRETRAQQTSSSGKAWAARKMAEGAS
jgi:hypothetical protein